MSEDTADEFDNYNTARDIEGGDRYGRYDLFSGLNLVVAGLAAIILAGAAALIFLG